MEKKKSSITHQKFQIIVVMHTPTPSPSGVFSIYSEYIMELEVVFLWAIIKIWVCIYSRIPLSHCERSINS